MAATNSRGQGNQGRGRQPSGPQGPAAPTYSPVSGPATSSGPAWAGVPGYQPGSTTTDRNNNYDSSFFNTAIDAGTRAGQAAMGMGQNPNLPDMSGVAAVVPTFDGGGGSGMSAAQRAAVTDAYRNSFAGTGAAYDAYGNALRTIYDPSKANATWDQASKGVTSASEAGNARLGAIMDELNLRAATGRTAVNDAFSQGDARLQQVANRFGGMNQAANTELNSVLGRFDAGQIANQDAGVLQNLFAAGQMANVNTGNVFDAAMADRPAMFAALNADVGQGMTRDRAGLENQIAIQRAAAIRDNENALAKALADNEMGRFQSEGDLRLRLAELGITV
jgi:hypothetical protein